MRLSKKWHFETSRQNAEQETSRQAVSNQEKDEISETGINDFLHMENPTIKKEGDKLRVLLSSED